MSNIKGKISQVIGPVIDVSFEKGVELPNIFDALVVTKSNGTKVVLEVQSHVGEGSVRTVSMDSTDGFTRGMEVTATGTGIKWYAAATGGTPLVTTTALVNGTTYYYKVRLDL